jgi:hypothetical protein
MDRRAFLAMPAGFLLVSDKDGLQAPAAPAAAPGASLARQNRWAGIRRRDMVPPQGMTIDFTGRGVQIRNAIAGSGSEKPPLAALLDDMWHSKKLPLLDSDSGMLLWSRNKDEMMCYPNQAAMAALGGFPVDEIKLHAIDGHTAAYLGYAMILKPDAGKSMSAGTAARPAVILDGADSFQDFREEMAGYGNTLQGAVYFISLHFSDTPEQYLKLGGLPLSPRDKYAGYDMASPYCFPIKFKAAFTGKDSPVIYRISKSGRFSPEAADEAMAYRGYEVRDEQEHES